MPLCTTRAAELTRLPTFVYDRCPSPRHRFSASYRQRHGSERGDDSSIRNSTQGNTVNDSSIISESRYVDVRIVNPRVTGAPTRGSWNSEYRSELHLSEQSLPRNAKLNDSPFSESAISREGCSGISASMSLSRNLRDGGVECGLSPRELRSRTCSRSSQEALGCDSNRPRSEYSPPTRVLRISSSISPRNSPRRSGDEQAISTDSERNASKRAHLSWVGCSPSSSSRTSPRSHAREPSPGHAMSPQASCSSVVHDSRLDSGACFGIDEAVATSLPRRGSPTSSPRRCSPGLERKTLYSYTLQQICGNGLDSVSSRRVHSLSPESPRSKVVLTSSRESSSNRRVVASPQSLSPPHIGRTHSRSEQSFSPRSIIDCSAFTTNFLRGQDDETKQHSTSHCGFAVSPVQSLTPRSCASITELKQLAGLSPIKTASATCLTPEEPIYETSNERNRDISYHSYPSSPAQSVSPQKFTFAEENLNNGSIHDLVDQPRGEFHVCTASDRTLEADNIPQPAQGFPEIGAVDREVTIRSSCSSRRHSPARHREETPSLNSKDNHIFASADTYLVAACVSPNSPAEQPRQASPGVQPFVQATTSDPCSSRQQSPDHHRGDIPSPSNKEPQAVLPIATHFMMASTSPRSSTHQSRPASPVLESLIRPCSSRRQSPNRYRESAPSPRQVSPALGTFVLDILTSSRRLSPGRHREISISPSIKETSLASHLLHSITSPNTPAELSRHASPVFQSLGPDVATNSMCSSRTQSPDRHRHDSPSPKNQESPPGSLARRQLSPDSCSNSNRHEFQKLPCESHGEESCWEILQRLHLIDDSSPLSSNDSRIQFPEHESSDLHDLGNGILQAPRRTPMTTAPISSQRQSPWPKGTLTASALEEDAVEPCPVSLPVRADTRSQNSGQQCASIIRLGEVDIPSKLKLQLHRPPPVQTSPRSPEDQAKPYVQLAECEDAIRAPRTPIWSPPACWEVPPGSSPLQRISNAGSHDQLGAATSPHPMSACRLSPVKDIDSPRSAVLDLQSPRQQESFGSLHTLGIAPSSWAPTQPRRPDRCLRSASPKQASSLRTPSASCVEDESPSNIQWTAAIDRRSGSPLGVTLNSSSLEVQSVCFGLIKSWNANNPEKAVSVGDRVVEVNGIRDTLSIIDECEGKQMLHITFRRSGPQSTRSSMRSAHGKRGRPTSPSRIVDDTVEVSTADQRHSSAIGGPVCLPPRHHGSSPCPENPSLCLLSTTISKTANHNVDAQSTYLDASLISDSIGSTNITWRPHQLNPPIPEIGTPSSFQAQLDYISAHGHAGARHLAESIVQRATAEGMLLQEVDKACRLQAQREVAEWSRQCRSWPHISLKSSQVAKTSASSAPMQEVGTASLSSRHSSQFDVMKAARDVFLTQERRSNGEDDNSDSLEELPLPDSPSPKCGDDKNVYVSVGVSSENRRLGVMQPPTANYFPISASQSIATQPHASPAKLDKMFDSLKSWAGSDGGATASEGFAALVQSAVEASNLATRVRDLRKVTRGAKRKQLKFSEDHANLTARLAEECRKTKNAQDHLSKLRETVENLQRNVAPIPQAQDVTVVEQMPPAPILSDDLKKAKAEQRAQEVLYEVTFKVLKKLQVAPDPSPRINPSLTVKLPGVVKRPVLQKQASRGPDWASSAGLPELGTPALPVKVWGKDGAGAEGGEGKIDENTEEGGGQDSDSEKPRKLGSAIMDDLHEEGEENDNSLVDDRSCTTSTSDLGRIRMLLEKAKTYENESFTPAKTSPNMPRQGRSHSGEKDKGRAHTMDSKALASVAGVLGLPPEIVELVAMVLISQPKLRAADAPEEVVAMMDDMKKRMSSDDPQKCDASMLTPDESARIWRLGVTVGAVDPALLAAYLGKEKSQDVRQAFCIQWVEGWLGPYLETRSHIFAATPETQDRRIFAWHTAETHYGRQCGRVLVDGMRDLFGRAMRLTGVEQEALTRLLEEFARVLCLEEEIQKRFRYVQVPDAERPKGLESLEHAVFLLTYWALLLNTALHNRAARGKAPTSKEFSKQGRTIAGFQEVFCEKMYDLIKKTPLGL